MGNKIKKTEVVKQSTDKKTYYAIMRLHKWETIKLQLVGHKLPFPIQMAKPKGGEVGYIPVFDSMENAIKFNDGKVDNIAILQDV
jgi:hypothetical protein